MSTNTDSPSPDTSVATEFVLQEFETEVDPDDVQHFAEQIEGIVRTLRSRVVSDDRLEELLRSGPGTNVLRENDSKERSDPEPLTQSVIIEPLFDLLGYDVEPEAGGLSDRRGQQADYAIPLRDVDTIDSSRLLIEAEPLNKRLDQHSHGLGQVKDWLAIDEFEADFGIATDGVRWILLKRDRDTYGYDTISEVDLQPVFLAAFENITGRQVSLNEWLEDDYEDYIEALIRGFEYDNFLSIAGDAPQIIRKTKEEITDEFYDHYVHLVFGIVDEEERSERSLIGEGVVPPKNADGDDIRLFSVGLMNRLIFIKFLEDKGLVRSSLLRDLADTHESGVNPGSFYKTYLEPLFYGVFDERPSEREERIRDIDMYRDVPYLNGGLFRPTIENGGDFHEQDFDVRDSVLISIIDLLERYTFSADGSPRDLDPSILGKVFEKTINYITGEPGDQKKDLGAFYTPDEITSFSAQETVQPALLDRFQTYLVEKRDWPEAEVEGYDDVYDLLDTLPESADLAEALLNEVDNFRALDPACGSGHFLTSVLSEIVEVRKALHGLQGNDLPTWKLRKKTVIENVYGVDIVDPAVEIAKLRLWLSIISEVDPEAVDEYSEDELALPNVIFNIRQGNSLIGYTELIETGAEEEQARLDAWGEDTVRSMYGDIIAAITRHKRAETTEEALDHLQQAESLLEEYRGDLNEKVLRDFHSAGAEDVTLDQIQSYEPFHWVLEFAEVYADGGFDIIVGNPPWEELSPSRDDFFPRYDKRFRTRMPSDKDAKEAELLDNPEIAEAYEEYKQDIQRRAQYFRDGSAYQLQSPSIDGRKVGNERDLSMLFFERVFQLASEDGYIAQVLPGVIFNGAAGKDLRLHTLENTTVENLVGFENRGIFDGLHFQYRFGVITLKNSGETEIVEGVFNQTDTEILDQLDEKGLKIPKEVLRDYSPEARIFPYIEDAREVEVLRKVLSHPPASTRESMPWYLDPYTEVHRSQDSDRFIEDEQQGDYPVIGGRNMWQYTYDPTFFENLESPSLWSVDEDVDPDKSAKLRIREKNVRRLKRDLYDELDGTGSQKSFVNEKLEQNGRGPLSEDDVLLDCTEYRLVYREIARPTDERTVIATVIPKGTVCYHKLYTIRPYEINPEPEDLSEAPLHSVYDRIFDDKELFVAAGLLNSIPFDFLMRTKIDNSIVRYKFIESQMPRLTEGDEWFDYISSRAARLNCYGDEFEEMRERLGGIEAATDPQERQRLRAEIDAAAFHAYGLNKEETQFVLDDFYRVNDPRIMTEEYFDLVWEKYQDLA
ncbi:hypothetical protein OB919_15800 [Halobacteria archaeon AArc-curdl1]|uniref:site-specific DNA-methyltransferase (adenine-specific) n=1 Tax=Natronosalvus hydrolyticus TaxID=2979988 RepID=A0AAP2ZAM8_9EURY|nr:hypothetical protein [Halobacteria archaeon AArc-curdl1]